ncbi:hypothetical protein EON65_16820 [archaeon]|nr:MAG: hypothetical protein EON65_16820 [archaeon]
MIIKSGNYMVEYRHNNVFIIHHTQYTILHTPYTIHSVWDLSESNLRATNTSNRASLTKTNSSRRNSVFFNKPTLSTSTSAKVIPSLLVYKLDKSIPAYLNKINGLAVCYSLLNAYWMCGYSHVLGIVQVGCVFVCCAMHSRHVIIRNTIPRTLCTKSDKPCTTLHHKRILHHALHTIHRTPYIIYHTSHTMRYPRTRPP